MTGDNLSKLIMSLSLYIDLHYSTQSGVNVDGSTVIPGFDVGRGDPSGGDGTNNQGPPLKKRKPILTLKIDRIFSEKGLPYIQKEFPKLKFKGKGHEVSFLHDL